MTFSVKMPALGESVTEGTVTRWLKAEGDHINVDEPLLEVSTDKVDTEIPSPVSGTLSKILVQIDATVAVDPTQKCCAGPPLEPSLIRSHIRWRDNKKNHTVCRWLQAAWH